MYNEWLCPYPGYGVYRHFQNVFDDMVAFCFIITIYFKFGFILINNNIWSAHTVHTYYRIKRIFSGVYWCITCEWLGPSYTSINSGKNAFNPYNSVTKFFFSSFVLKIYLRLWGSPVRTHTFHRCVSAMNNKMN